MMFLIGGVIGCLGLCLLSFHRRIEINSERINRLEVMVEKILKVNCERAIERMIKEEKQ